MDSPRNTSTPAADPLKSQRLAAGHPKPGPTGQPDDGMVAQKTSRPRSIEHPLSKNEPRRRFHPCNNLGLTLLFSMMLRRENAINLLD